MRLCWSPLKPWSAPLALGRLGDYSAANLGVTLEDQYHSLILCVQSQKISSSLRIRMVWVAALLIETYVPLDSSVFHTSSL